MMRTKQSNPRKPAAHTKSRRIVGVSRASAQPTTVKALRHKVGMTRPVFARLIDMSERSLADLETHKRAPSNSVERRVAEIDRLHAALAQIIDPAEIGRWLQTPNPAFNDLKPLELIERGQSDRLWRMIHQLESGEAF